MWQISLDAVEHGIDHDLTTRVTKPYKNCKHLGKRLAAMLGGYRARAVLRYLLRGDARSFSEDMAREGLTHLTLLEASHAKLDVPASVNDASTFGPLICAIAGGHWKLARQLDARMHRSLSEDDDPASFALTAALRALVRDADLPDLAALDGTDFVGAADMLRAIAAQDARSFERALSRSLDARSRAKPSELQELGPGEEALHVEALGLVRLARHRDLGIRMEHTLIPEALQKVSSKLPRDGYPTWPG